MRISRKKSQWSTGPGPGTYKINFNTVTPAPPAYTLAGRTPEPLLDACQPNPGPGSYDGTGRGVAAVLYGKGRCYTIASRRHVLVGDRSTEKAPGPGAYDTGACLRATSHREPAYTIAGRNGAGAGRYLRGDKSPGPGAYSATFSSSGPSHSILARLKRPAASDLAPGPGPGSYSYTGTGVWSSSPAVTIATRAGNATGRDSGGERSPGPGAYNPTLPTLGPSYTLYARVTRAEPRAVGCAPGPGQYNSGTGGGGPFILLHPKYPNLESRRSSPSPGPAAYNPTLPRECTQSPSLAIHPKTLPRVSHMTTTPGPGTYFIDKLLQQQQQQQQHGVYTWSSPAVTIGSRIPRRPPEMKPGPGAYNIGNGWDGPTVSMKSRKPFNYANGNPGPGEYFWDGHMACPYGSSAPAFSMGMRYSDKGGGREHNPGHGAYEVLTQTCGTNTRGSMRMSSSCERD